MAAHRTPEHPIAASISTRARRLGTLRSFLRFATHEEWLPGNLGATIDVPKLLERLPKPLPAHDRDQLLEALPNDTLAQLQRSSQTTVRTGPR